jgi:acyl CoA:acetate/3-ketoacid CoA transferase beta subunit
MGKDKNMNRIAMKTKKEMVGIGEKEEEGEEELSTIKIGQKEVTRIRNQNMWLKIDYVNV